MRRDPGRMPMSPLAAAAWAPVASPARTGAEEPPPAAARNPAPPTGSGWLSRVAVRSVNRIAIVPVQEIVRLEAEDNYVRIWAADRAYLTKETLAGLLARLDPSTFLRIHRSHAVNVQLVRELRPLLHGEYRLLLAGGTEVVSGRSYRQRIQDAFGLTRSAGDG